MKEGTGVILFLLQYKQEAINERMIPWHAGIQYFDLREDRVFSLPTCKFSS